MDYNKLYNQLVTNAQDRVISGYTETHHIIPRSMGGNNLKTNKVVLTAREHFLAHWLLWKIHRTPGMANAFFAMTRKGKGQERIVTSRKYEIAKKAMSDAKKGENNFWYGTTGPMGGKTHTEEFKLRHKDIMKKSSEYKKGKPVSEIPGFNTGKSVATQFKPGGEPWNAGRTGEQSHWFNRSHTEESRAKMCKPKEKVACPHCNQVGGISQMKRWHYDNCKHRTIY